ncbi:helix-turn-helix domain-containing protein [Dyella choica]|uniref:XRE family transcriptional regulator n=1 Tax=Dyella choica TaxID=1927959 RepID=A0A432MC29_9GAMM|nr:XRE family transcriptional regulator [Dyella choica]
MPKGKTIHSKEYPVFLQLLVETRQEADLTQVKLAQKVGLSQPYVSAVERGVLRLDTLQLRTWLAGCGSDLGSFGLELERRLKVFEGRSGGAKRTRKI